MTNWGENWALNTDSLRNTILECYKTIDEIHRNHLYTPKTSHLENGFKDSTYLLKLDLRMKGR